MTAEKKPGVIPEAIWACQVPVIRLANTFIGGRISGWVERNRQVLAEGDIDPVELELLDKLCPGFAT